MDGGRRKAGERQRTAGINVVLFLDADKGVMSRKHRAWDPIPNVLASEFGCAEEKWNKTECGERAAYRNGHFI